MLEKPSAPQLRFLLHLLEGPYPAKSHEAVSAAICHKRGWCAWVGYDQGWNVYEITLDGEDALNAWGEMERISFERFDRVLGANDQFYLRWQRTNTPANHTLIGPWNGIATKSDLQLAGYVKLPGEEDMAQILAAVFDGRSAWYEATDNERGTWLADARNVLQRLRHHQ